MQPTQQLINDHEVILQMLSSAKKLSELTISTRIVNVGKLKMLIDFSQNFTDVYHHAKEEKQLFVKLIERGLSQEQGPVAVMLYEHKKGRELIQTIGSAMNEYIEGNKNVYEIIGKTIIEYCNLLEAHIYKENNVLFPMSDRLMNEMDQLELQESFKRIDEIEFDIKRREYYYKIPNEII